jgi:hypothetical protein
LKIESTRHFIYLILERLRIRTNEKPDDRTFEAARLLS